ncbi:hypothetical protein ES705_20618 [subsurface metagenome]
MKKQSKEDKLKRLKKGQCPIHGLVMLQVDLIYFDNKLTAVVECPRKDCNIRATEKEPFKNAILLEIQ